jgi:uncharacterized membrane protein YkvA (DUF1232 family)
MTSTTRFSDQAFWRKLRHAATRAGRELTETALCLYYVAREGDAPAWAKATAIGALGYLINPFDLVPDLTPIAGYSDDLAVLAAAIATLALHITPAIRAKAASRAGLWFGR